MKIYVTSIFVDDQAAALKFYTETLGFVKKTDIDLGSVRWLTVVPADYAGVELLLEPSTHDAVGPFKSALVKDGIAYTSFAVEDIAAEFDRLLSLGVRFTQEPAEAGDNWIAVLDDTCGNLIQLIQLG